MSELDKALKMVKENNKKLKGLSNPTSDKKRLQLEKKRQGKFVKVVKPVIKFINDFYHPHCKVIIEDDKAELVMGEQSFLTKEFIKD